MKRAQLLAWPATDRGSVTRAAVRGILDDGTVVVSGANGSADEVPCDLLHASGGRPLRLFDGDRVLVWCPEGERRGVVIGRIGPSVKPAEDVPSEVVIEATQQLTLRCAEGSIALRGDGKILIKGKDLVSRAQRTNRIKGGAVSIN
jgi:hypothetical protein